LDLASRRCNHLTRTKEGRLLSRPFFQPYPAQKIPLADVHAVVTQQVVCSHVVEKKFGDRPVLQEREPLELDGAIAQRNRDVRVSLPSRCREHAVDEIDGLFHALKTARPSSSRCPRISAGRCPRAGPSSSSRNRW
jgi:hypothetical protein